MKSLRLLNAIVLTAIACNAYAVNADVEKLNGQIQAQLKQLQDTQNQQVLQLNGRIQKQMQDMQTTLQNQIQTLGKQNQQQLQQLQTGLQQQIAQVKGEVDKVKK